MRQRILVFLVITFSSLVKAYGQAPFTPTPATSPLAIQNLTTTYKFHQDAVWAHLEATVRDHQDGFNISIKSDTTLTGWILRDSETNEVVQKGGLGGVKTFTAEIPKSFKRGYRLSVFVKTDQDQVPAVLNLTPQEGKKDSNGISDASIPDFEENPDHAFNAMVKSLYKQAILAFSSGDKNNALNYLNQAADLDPTQAQVQSFRRLIQTSGLEKPSATQTTHETKSPAEKENSDGGNAEDLASSAKKAESNGDLLKARTLYGKAIRLKPDQTDWSAALDRINRRMALQKFETAVKAKNRPDAQSAYTKLKALDPDNPKLTEWKQQLDALLSSAPKSDTDAQADVLYNLGLGSYAQDDFAGAKKYWQETLKIKPNHQQASGNLEKLLDAHPELK